MTTINLHNPYKTNIWLSKDQITSLYSSGYWNNKDTDSPEWLGILDGNFETMEQHLQKSGLLPDLRACLGLAERLNRPVGGIGADLAAGVLWSIPHLLTQPSISKIYCVDMSQHRLLEIGPQVLAHYGVTAAQVELCLGSFYEIMLPDHSLDFIVLIAAFHHAEKPDQLLQEIRRVLKKDGVAIIVGEHKVSQGKRLPLQSVKFLVSHLLPKRLQERLLGKAFPKQSILTYWHQRPQTDPILGDHYYFSSDYKTMFTRNGFEMANELTHNLFQYFVIWPK